MNSTKTKQRKPKLNVKLLRKIQRHILEEPRRFFMSWFIARGKPGMELRVGKGCFLPVKDLPEIAPECGTAACIAGWANLLTGSKRPAAYVRARRILGISARMSRRLFSAMQWPSPFHIQYDQATTPRQRAKIAAARIEHLITEGE